MIGSIGDHLPYAKVGPNSVILKDASVVTGLDFKPIPMDGRASDEVTPAIDRIDAVLLMWPNDATLTVQITRVGSIHGFVPESPQGSGLPLVEWRQKFYRRLVGSGMARKDVFRIYITVHPGDNGKIGPGAYLKHYGASVSFLKYIFSPDYDPGKEVDEAVKARESKAIDLALDLQRTLVQSGSPEARMLTGVEIVSDAYKHLSGLAEVEDIPPSHPSPLRVLSVCEIEQTPAAMLAGGRFVSTLSLIDPPIVDAETDFPTLYRSVQSLPLDFTFQVVIEPLDRAESLAKLSSMERFAASFAYTQARTLSRIFPMEAEDIAAKVDEKMLSKSEEARLAKQAVQERARLAYVQGLVMVSAKDQAALHEAEQQIKSRFRESYLTVVKQERFFRWPVFLSMLPGYGHRGTRKVTQLTSTAVKFAPLCGALYQIGNKAVLPVFTTSGACVKYDPFSIGDGARHKAIIATTGGGKTMFINEWIISKMMLGDGSKFVIIDISAPNSRSYERIVKLLDGKYFAVHPVRGAKPVKINPLLGLVETYEAFRANPEKRGDWAEESNFALDFLETIVRGADKPSLDPSERGALTEILVDLVKDASANRYEPTIEEFADRLSGHKFYSAYAHAFAPFRLGGELSGFFNEPVGAEAMRAIYESPLVVYDLYGLDQPHFRALRRALFPAINKFLSSVFNSRLDVPKFLIVDEAAVWLEDPESSKFIISTSQRGRKQGVCVAVVLQDPQYVAEEKSGKRYLAVADELIFLPTQKATASHLEAIGMTQAEIETITTLKTVPGQYSMLYIKSSKGNAKLVLRLPPQDYWLATTDPSDVTIFASALMRHNGNVSATIEALSQ